MKQGRVVRLHRAKGRTCSSQRWLKRHLNDPYVYQAKVLGYRSRAAFKLKELDDKWGFLRPGDRVIDLGAAPGGWAQVALSKIHTAHRQGWFLGVDLLPIPPLPKAVFLKGDFMDQVTVDQIHELAPGPVQVVLSDMAAPSCGHGATDHLRIMALAESAFLFSQNILAPGGTYLAKTLQGGTEGALLNLLKHHFSRVVHAKPPASRSDSSEMYVLALGFRP